MKVAGADLEPRTGHGISDRGPLFAAFRGHFGAGLG